MSPLTLDTPNGTALPTGWEHRSLGDIAQITMGNSPPGSSYNNKGRGIPLINGPVEFSEGAFGLTVESKYTTSPTKVCQKGDLLICVRGSTTGRTNIAAFDACIGRGVAAIRAQQQQAYLNHFIRTLQSRIYASGQGSTFPCISQQQLFDLQVPLPFPGDRERSIAEQKRIADILDKADAIRRKREAVAEEIRILPRVVFRKMFGDSTKNNQNWRIVRVDDAGDVQLGRQRSPKYQTGRYTRPYMRVANVFEDRIDLSDVLAMDFNESDFAKYKLESGDILLNEGQSTELVGRPAMWRNDLSDCCFQNTLVRFRAFPEVTDPEYALAVFLDFLNRGAFAKVSSKTSSVAHLGAARFAAIPFPLPPLDLQQEYARIRLELRDLADRHNAAARETGNLFNSLVQRAFKAEL